MHKVKHWSTGEEFVIYGTKQTEDATTWFLTYQDDFWIWVDAENYIPVT